ncbi:MAG: hypothetical protein R6W67_02355 [Bacteroidales bacterium]
MKRTITIILLTGSVFLSSYGQGTGDFLKQVSDAHPVIKHYESVLEARRAESVTGNTPGEFTAGFGYFPGTPESIGLKRTFEAAQSFEFPTTYIIRGRLNRETFSLAETEFSLGRTETLLEARLMAYEYISLGKRAGVLKEKHETLESVRLGWNTLLDEGAVTILDYNRLLLELSRARSQVATEGAAMEALRVKLDYISGGHSELLEGAGYDNYEDIDRDDLIELRRQLHPAFLFYEKEYDLSLREVDLTRAGNLPGLELGFGSEIIAGEHHTGPRIGISIPVWTNRNQLKLSKAHAAATGAGRDAAFAMLVAETRSQYEYCRLARLNFEEMNAELSHAGETSLLMKSLTEKEITITEYFAYMEAMYESMLMLIDLENEYFAALARLNDHKLVTY